MVVDVPLRLRTVTSPDASCEFLMSKGISRRRRGTTRWWARTVARLGLVLGLISCSASFLVLLRNWNRYEFQQTKHLIVDAVQDSNRRLQRTLALTPKLARTTKYYFVDERVLVDQYVPMAWNAVRRLTLLTTNIARTTKYYYVDERILEYYVPVACNALRRFLVLATRMARTAKQYYVDERIVDYYIPLMAEREAETRRFVLQAARTAQAKCLTMTEKMNERIGSITTTIASYLQYAGAQMVDYYVPMAWNASRRFLVLAIQMAQTAKYYYVDERIVEQYIPRMVAQEAATRQFLLQAARTAQTNCLTMTMETNERVGILMKELASFVHHAGERMMDEYVPMAWNASRRFLVLAIQMARTAKYYYVDERIVEQYIPRMVAQEAETRRFLLQAARTAQANCLTVTEKMNERIVSHTTNIASYLTEVVVTTTTVMMEERNERIARILHETTSHDANALLGGGTIEAAAPAAKTKTNHHLANSVIKDMCSSSSSNNNNNIEGIFHTLRTYFEYGNTTNTSSAVIGSSGKGCNNNVSTAFPKKNEAVLISFFRNTKTYWIDKYEYAFTDRLEREQRLAEEEEAKLREAAEKEAATKEAQRRLMVATATATAFAGAASAFLGSIATGSYSYL